MKNLASAQTAEHHCLKWCSSARAVTRFLIITADTDGRYRTSPEWETNFSRKIMLSYVKLKNFRTFVKNYYNPSLFQWDLGTIS